ncbi:hypothetical protein DFH27DRAFT_650115 [Peziza echinospora]|nr:hypothetical protein DFH27DRAFT_650115 [Peziza echinospora]
MSSIVSNPAHRTACRALYKAFLSSCKKLPPGPVQSGATKHVKHEFKKNAKVRSVKELQRIFSEAYGHERILRAAATENDHTALTHLTTHLTTLTHLKTPLPARPYPPAPPPQPPLTRLQKAQLKREKRTLNRLKHHIPPNPPKSPPTPWQPKRYLFPLMASANGFPLLRRRGTPTTEIVATTIKNLIKQKQKRQDLQEYLEDTLLDYAKAEDAWDQLLLPHLLRAGLETPQPGEGTWEEQVRWSMRDVADRMRQRDVQNRNLADEFWEIENAGRRKHDLILETRRARRWEIVAEKRLAQQKEREREEMQMGNEVSAGKGENSLLNESTPTNTSAHVTTEPEKPISGKT